MKFCIIIFAGIVIWMTNVPYSMNLINNPNFEKLSSCPQKFFLYGGIESLANWFAPVSCTPDLFSDCSGLKSKGTLKNWAGCGQENKSNYIGLILYERNKNKKKDKTCIKEKYTELIANRLVAELDTGKVYKYSFDIKLAEISSFIPHSMNILFVSEKDLNESEYKNIYLDVKLSQDLIDNSIKIELPKTIGDNKWIRVSGFFSSKGGEENIMIIGSLNSSELSFTKKKKLKGFKTNDKSDLISYVFIDNIEVMSTPS